MQPGYCRRHGQPADGCGGCLAECRAALAAAEGELERLRDVLSERREIQELVAPIGGAVRALEEIAERAWRDEGGRIAAAVARDGLAPLKEHAARHGW